jgi:hypothetical protein
VAMVFLSTHRAVACEGLYYRAKVSIPQELV